MKIQINNKNFKKNQKTSTRYFNNTPTLKSGDLISHKQKTRASYFHESSKSFEELIKNDTNEFNKMMESQYKDFEYSYYYVKSNNDSLVI